MGTVAMARWTCSGTRGARLPERTCRVRRVACACAALAEAAVGGAASASTVKLGADVAAGLYDMYAKTARTVPADAALAGIAKAYQLADLAVNVTRGLRDAYRYLRTRDVPYRTCAPVDPAKACRGGDRACAKCARAVQAGYERAWGWIEKVIENGEETAAYVSRSVAFGDFGSSLPLVGLASVFVQAAWKDQRKQIGAVYERYAGIYRRKLAEFLYDLDDAYWTFSRCLGGDDVVEQADWYLRIGHPTVRGLGDCYAHLPYRRLTVKLEFPPGSVGWQGIRQRQISGWDPSRPSLPAGADGRRRGGSSPGDGMGGEAPVDLLGDGGAGAGTGAGTAPGGPGAGTGGAAAQTQAGGPQAGRRVRRCEEAEGVARGAGERQDCREDADRRR